MGGLPKAGKTTFVHMLDSVADRIVSPGEQVVATSEQERKEQYLAAWAKCVEQVTRFCSKRIPQTMIFDSTGSNLNYLRRWNDLCDIHDIKILYILVHALRDQCVTRGAELGILAKYVPRLQQCCPLFKGRMKIIKNLGTIDELRQQANLFIEQWRKEIGRASCRERV